jgi:protein-S-isoprenylcysteine O-methyltransferase Ste14
MVKVLLFASLSLPIIALSWRNLFRPETHGFYRFLSWECVILLFVFCYKTWFADPLSMHQIFSWIFLVISLYLVIVAVILIHRVGKPGMKRNEKDLYSFERTSELVTTGIYKYIRHPMYTSLLFLTWGIYLKNPTVLLLVPAILSSVFLYLTALIDEKECIRYFGDRYLEYMKGSKRFVPFVF